MESWEYYFNLPEIGQLPDRTREFLLATPLSDFETLEIFRKGRPSLFTSEKPKNISLKALLDGYENSEGNPRFIFERSGLTIVATVLIEHYANSEETYERWITAGRVGADTRVYDNLPVPYRIAADSEPYEFGDVQDLSKLLPGTICTVGGNELLFVCECYLEAFQGDYVANMYIFTAPNLIVNDLELPE